MINPFVNIINQSLSEPQASLLNGILFGVKANFPKDLYQALIDTGTIHIIALSGQNISILGKIISEITLPVLGRRISSLITVIVIFGFVIFVGAEPTIIRAAIMGSISLLAVYFGRQNWSLLSLLLAAGIMLIINPEWITNLSFQLSFFATLGMIIFGNIKPQEVKGAVDEVKREIKISLRTTISAQIFTVPIIFYYFRRISLVAPISNLLVGWVIAPIMGLGLALSLLGYIWLPLGQIIGWLTWVPLTFVINMIELTAKIPFASIGF